MFSPRIVGGIAHDEKGGECSTHAYINCICIYTHKHAKNNLVRKPGRKRQIFKPKYTVQIYRLKWREDVRILRKYPLAYITGGNFLSSWITTNFLRKTGCGIFSMRTIMQRLVKSFFFRRLFVSFPGVTTHNGCIFTAR